MRTPRYVYVVDDDAAVRRTLVGLLYECGYVARPFASATAFLDAAAHLPPCCVLLDLRMPDHSGLEVQAELARRGVALPIVFLSGHGDLPTGVLAMKRGAVDFLEKPVREEALLAVLDEVFARSASRDDTAARGSAIRRRIETMTPREREVIQLVAEGLRSREIADRLGITLQTAKVHRMRGMAKLQVTSLSQLSETWHVGTAAGGVADRLPVAPARPAAPPRAAPRAAAPQNSATR